MQNLKVPTIKSSEVLDNIVKGKYEPNKSILNNIRSELLKQFSLYEHNKKTLENIIPFDNFDKDQKKTLLNCYSRTGYLEKDVIKKSIKDIQKPHQKNKCPYCRIDTANTIDHYLPKDKFPEFAFLPINLIPCCSTCNSKKGEIWINNGERIFINYYFDNLDTDNFLKSEIEYDKNDIETSTNINYLIDTSNIGNEKLSKIIQSHFSKLELLERYSDLVGEELSNIYTSIIVNNCSLEGHIEGLKQCLRAKEELYGENYWQVVLYKSVLDSNYIDDVYNSKNL